jgi:SAM-dependent methyltransferase
MIEKYDIREKNIVEIGCGKGDFLRLICRLGNNKGIGIGPSVNLEQSEQGSDIQFIKEFYSEKHGELPADVIICRHTLEHIFETNEFIETVRWSLNNNSHVIFLVEVPNVDRILQIQAFWDIFYEHCSYFSVGSLARLLRKNRFEILDTYFEYNNQYLLMEVKPTREISGNVHPLEEPVKLQKEYVEIFVSEINKQIKRWHEKLLEMKTKNKKVAIWGGGSKAVGFLTHFDGLKVIKHVVDINPNIQGNFIPGIGIQYVKPEFMKEFNPDIIIATNGIYKQEIGKALAEMNLYPELVCL